MEDDDPFRFVVLDLAEKTLASSIDNIQFHTVDYPELSAQWAAMLRACRPKVPPVDWLAVRSLLWENIPKEIMMTEEFAEAVRSIFVGLTDAREGVKGANIVFAYDDQTLS